jgi:hypothetical protein
VEAQERVSITFSHIAIFKIKMIPVDTILNNGESKLVRAVRHNSCCCKIRNTILNIGQQYRMPVNGRLCFHQIVHINYSCITFCKICNVFSCNKFYYFMSATVLIIFQQLIQKTQGFVR